MVLAEDGSLKVLHVPFIERLARPSFSMPSLRRHANNDLRNQVVTLPETHQRTGACLRLPCGLGMQGDPASTVVFLGCALLVIPRESPSRGGKILSLNSTKLAQAAGARTFGLNQVSD